MATTELAEKCLSLKLAVLEIINRINLMTRYFPIISECTMVMITLTSKNN